MNSDSHPALLAVMARESRESNLLRQPTGGGRFLGYATVPDDDIYLALALPASGSQAVLIVRCSGAGTGEDLGSGADLSTPAIHSVLMSRPHGRGLRGTPDVAPRFNEWRSGRDAIRLRQQSCVAYRKDWLADVTYGEDPLEFWADSGRISGIGNLFECTSRGVQFAPASSPSTSSLRRLIATRPVTDLHGRLVQQLRLVEHSVDERASSVQVVVELLGACAEDLVERGDEGLGMVRLVNESLKTLATFDPAKVRSAAALFLGSQQPSIVEACLEWIEDGETAGRPSGLIERLLAVFDWWSVVDPDEVLEAPTILARTVRLLLAEGAPQADLVTRMNRSRSPDLAYAEFLLSSPSPSITTGIELILEACRTLKTAGMVASLRAAWPALARSAATGGTDPRAFARLAGAFEAAIGS